MVSLTLTLSFHQPYILKNVRVFDIGSVESYFNDTKSRELMLRDAKEYYEPTLRTLLQLLKAYPQEFKVNLSLSGLVLEQMSRFSPELLLLLQELSNYDEVEFLGRTYYNSYLALFSENELKTQLLSQKRLIEKYFKKSPKVFHGALSSGSTSVLKVLKELSFEGMLYEADAFSSRPFQAYHSSFPELNIYTLSPSLSKDLGQKFYDSSWEEYPLQASQFASWLHNFNGNGEQIHLLLSHFSLFKENHKSLLDFFFELLEELKKENYDISFETFSSLQEPKSSYALNVDSMLDEALSKKAHSNLQKDVLSRQLALEASLQGDDNQELLGALRSLSCYDHIELIDTQNFKTSPLRRRDSLYDSSYDVYLHLQNALSDIEEKQKRRVFQRGNNTLLEENSKKTTETQLHYLKELIYE